MIIAERLCKTYRRNAEVIKVLNGLDLEVQTGEFLSIVGASGSGKSTLLHLLGTLDKPDAGTITFDGKRIDSLAGRERDRLRNTMFGFIFQFYHLLPELTTLENVLTPMMVGSSLWNWWGRRREARRRAEAMLERVGLTHRTTHRPRELSGGEMQRAAIARALAARPRVLFADEPTGNLDAAAGAEIVRLLRDLNRNDGVTIIMVAHNLELVASTDRFVRMTAGRIAQSEEGPQIAFCGIEELLCTMSTRVYINGKLFDKADAKVSVYDHGLLYGDGVFEGIRIYHGKVFKHKEHIDRLFESARSIALEIPMSRDDMMKAVDETVKANNKTNGYIRLVVTRGPGSLGLDPRKCEPQIIIIVDDISLYPAELYENGLEIITAATIRNHPNAVNPRVKSLNYLNNILAKIEAIRAGCFEAIMLNHLGEVAECTGDNLFLVKNGVLKTTTADSGILEGVTRNVVIDLARTAGIPVVECGLTRHDVYTADECFLTGTAAEIIGVTRVDGRPIGLGKPGPTTRLLREKFHAVTKA